MIRVLILQFFFAWNAYSVLPRLELPNVTPENYPYYYQDLDYLHSDAFLEDLANQIPDSDHKMVGLSGVALIDIYLDHKNIETTLFSFPLQGNDKKFPEMQSVSFLRDLKFRSKVFYEYFSRYVNHTLSHNDLNPDLLKEKFKQIAKLETFGDGIVWYKRPAIESLFNKPLTKGNPNSEDLTETLRRYLEFEGFLIYEKRDGQEYIRFARTSEYLMLDKGYPTREFLENEALVDGLIEQIITELDKFRPPSRLAQEMQEVPFKAEGLKIKYYLNGKVFEAGGDFFRYRKKTFIEVLKIMEKRGIVTIQKDKTTNPNSISIEDIPILNQEYWTY